MLHEFIASHREEIIGRCLTKASTRSNARLITAEINHGVPVFLDQLVHVLRLGLATNAEIGATALLHGHDLLIQGFSASEVVHDYGDVCQTVTELAVELDTIITANDFRMFNRCLDDAIAGAVTEYGRERHQVGVAASADSTERDDRELKRLSQIALLAFEAIRTRNIGVAGSTGDVLHRSLTEICTFAHRRSD